MNVIPNASAIGRGIIGAKDLQMRTNAQSRLQDEWNQMRFRIVIFANISFWIGTGGIEVTKRRVAPAIGGGIIGQSPLDGKLGSAVGVDRPLLFILRDRHCLR